jgi:hypothetical protein
MSESVKLRNRIAVFGLLANVLLVCIAYAQAKGSIENPWWPVFGSFLMFQFMCVAVGHIGNNPAYQFVWRRIYLRFKFACTEMYVTDRTGLRNVMLFSLGWVQQDDCPNRCYNLTCLAFSFSIGWLPAKGHIK